jgi:hypothetical protein
MLYDRCMSAGACVATVGRHDLLQPQAALLVYKPRTECTILYTEYVSLVCCCSRNTGFNIPCLVGMSRFGLKWQLHLSMHEPIQGSLPCT